MNTIYPALLTRIKAMFLDSLMLIVFMVMATIIFSFFENVPIVVRMCAFVFIFFLYDPIFTSFFGGTVGHLVIGIRVKRDNDRSKNILFPFAVLRFALKSLLGIISLLTITSNSENKAIHDLVVGSIVVYK